MKFLAFLVAVSIFLSAAEAKNKKFCGKRDGTAGNAYLVDKKGTELITLSQQGGAQYLLEQADQFIGPNTMGEIGTQNGTKYCVIAEIDKSGEPKKIIKAFRQK